MQYCYIPIEILSPLDIEVRQWDDDHFSPSNGAVVIKMLLPYINDDLQWIQGERLFTLIMSFLIAPLKTNRFKQPGTYQDRPAFGKSGYQWVYKIIPLAKAGDKRKSSYLPLN